MKITKLLSSVILVIIIITTFASCTPTEEGEKTIKIIIINSDLSGITYTEITDSLYLGQVLDEMVTEGDLSLTVETELYGRMIKSIGNLTPVLPQWILICSDEADPTLVSEASVVTYNGTVYKMNMLGIDSMPIYDGRTYVFSISE